MNIEYKYLPNGQVEVLTDKGLQERDIENNINEILTLENKIEKMDNLIKDLESRIDNSRKRFFFNKKAKFLICGGIPFAIPTLAVCINGITNNSIPNDVLLSLFVNGSFFSIPALACFKFYSHKIKINNRGIKNEIIKATEIKEEYVKRLEKIKNLEMQNTKFNEHEIIKLSEPIILNNNDDLDDEVVTELNNAYNQGTKKRVRILKNNYNKK